MHVRELAELAAAVALHGRALVAGSEEIGLHNQEEYWAASKCRLDRWGRLLRRLAEAARLSVRPPALQEERVRPVLEEIFASELLTRLWTAVACGYDAARGRAECGPVARNIWSGHLEARRRLLALLADGRVITLPEALRLNKVRRRVERWTDMLLGYLVGVVPVDEFCFEPGRARDFAQDAQDGKGKTLQSVQQQIVLVSLRASLEGCLGPGSCNRDLNRRIGGAILRMLADARVDAAALVPSLWLERIEHGASEAETLLARLWQLERDPCPVVTAAE
jgi:hypothetical protein